jgi:general secretion pathway protein I
VNSKSWARIIRNRQQGFTLLEVMVALLVVAVALPAMLILVMTQLDGAASIRDKTFAYWIADNELTRIRLRQTYFPGDKLAETESGQVEMIGTQWHWELQTQTTEMEKFLRIDLSVSKGSGTGKNDNNEPLALISGFIGE